MICAPNTISQQEFAANTTSHGLMDTRSEFINRMEQLRLGEIEREGFVVLEPDVQMYFPEL